MDRRASPFEDATPESASNWTRGIPSPSSAHWRLGNAYQQLGQIEKARQAYTEALSLDGDNEEAKKALKSLPGS